MEIVYVYAPREIVRRILSFNILPYTSLVCRFFYEIEREVVQDRLSYIDSVHKYMDGVYHRSICLFMLHYNYPIQNIEVYIVNLLLFNMRDIVEKVYKRDTSIQTGSIISSLMRLGRVVDINFILRLKR